MDSEVGRVYLTADVRDLDKVRQQVEELRRLATQTNQGGGGIPTSIGPVGGGNTGGGSGRPPLSPEDANALRKRGVTENYIRENYDIGNGPPPRPPTTGSRGGGTSDGDPIGRGGGAFPGRRNVMGGDPEKMTGGGAEGVMFAMQRKGHEELAEAQKKLAKESKDAAGHVQGFGLRTAWILRSATGGGPMGMMGGGVGALAGLAFGNPAFGALMGNIAGRKMSDTAGTLGGWAGLASPSTTHAFELAERDTKAVIGRAFIPAVNYFTQKTRELGDAAAANTGAFRKLGDIAINASEFFLSFTGINEKIRSEAAFAPGGSRGAAFSPLQGRVFGSADELYHAMAQQSMMLRPEAAPTSPSSMIGPITGKIEPFAFEQMIPGTKMNAEVWNQATQGMTTAQIASGLGSILGQALDPAPLFPKGHFLNPGDSGPATPYGYGIEAMKRIEEAREQRDFIGPRIIK